LNKEGKRIIAAKGGLETIIKVSTSTQSKKTKSGHNNYIGIKGYRILGVGYSDYAESSYPKTNRNLPFISWLGGFYDPPKHTKRNSTIL
jgi:Ca2+-transporting ATPase